MKKSTSRILSCLLAILSSGPAISQNVWTQHNDQSRTGWYPYETTLNTSNVNVNTFGIAFSQVVDEKICAQPLIVKNVNIAGQGVKNVVYVATQNNTVYAFDADNNVPAYWQVNFNGKIAPAPAATCANCRPPDPSLMHPSLCGGGYGDFHELMGIVSTPVIDTAAGIMYFVTKIVNPNDGPLDNHQYVPEIKDEYNYTTTCFHQYLHAVDIKSGNERANSPVEITATLPGNGDGQTSTNSGQIKFDPRRQFSRAGLVLSNGKIYITYAAHCDFNPSHGWVFSYNASSLTLANAYISSPNDGRGGIWMSGTAPAVDASGNLYISTGNSLNEDRVSANYNTYNASPSVAVNRGESVIKLAPDLTISSYFTPFNYIALNDADLDFGIQLMLLPNTGLVMTGCKDNNLYVMNQSNLGGYSSTQNNVVQTTNVGFQANMHSSFAYFGGATTKYAYQFSENTPLKAYPVTASGLGTPITNTTMLGPTGGTGGFMSVSSNGSDISTGILWAYHALNGCDANQSKCPGVLHALNANNITSELWNSSMLPADKLSGFNKFSCPTIALGKVYVAGNTNQLVVYGPKANTTCVNNVAVGKTATALTSIGGAPASNAVDGNTGTKWTSTSHNVDSIYVDLGGPFDICKIGINWDAAGYGKDFDIKVSSDKINWTTVSSVRGNTDLYNESNTAVNARYVSMRGITRGTSGGYSITEFQVFGSASSGCAAPTNLEATSSSTVSIFTNQMPWSTTDNDGTGFESGLKFRSDIAGMIKGIRFYKTAGNSGTHTGELYNAAGTRLASIVFTGETATGWQTMNFSTPVSIAANTTYTAAIYNPSGNYVEDNGFFAGAGLTNGPLTALADGVDGCNGPYDHAAAPKAPQSCYQSANYWVDVLFSTGTSSNSELITWDPVLNATSYVIQYRPNLSASWITRTSATNSVTLSALTCGSQYFYTVQAQCNAGLSSASNGSFTAASCSGGPTCDPLPTRFFKVDIGDIGVAGSTCLNGNAYTINGSGTDIGGTSDQFQFVFTNGNDIGDYDVYGRITSQTQPNGQSKTGIIIRDSLTGSSRFAYVAHMGTKMIFEYRSSPSGQSTTITAAGNFTLPYWAKINKTGTTYTAYISPDGVTWTPVGTGQNLNFGTDANNTPHYGMAVTSANNTVLSTGVIDNFTLVTAGATTPVANAGTTQTITLPTSTVTLDGSGSTGTITSYAWSLVSGPNTPAITNPTAVTTTVTGLIQGTYVFQLSVNAGVSTSQVTINVLPASGPSTSIFTTQIPASATDNDNQPTVGHEVGLRFRSNVAGLITGIRFYKTAGNTGTHIGELYSNAGGRLAQATFTGETATGWQTVTFATPVAITANTTYVAAYYSSLGYYVEDNNYFLNSGVTNGNLTALKDGVDGCNGPYLYTGTPAFPTACYLSANYWVDVTFAAGSSSPVANAGSNQTITLPTSSVTLNGNASTGTITSYAWTRVSGPNTPTITTPTAISTTVTGLIQGTYVFQLSVNGGVSTSQVTITVLPAAGPVTTIFTTQVPASVTDNDNMPTVGHEVGLRFRSSIAGFISGVRFYKTAGLIGTHIGELYSNTGTRLAQATFTNETATGWQQVNFSAPVAITANTTYVVACFSSLGYYVEDNNYFLNSGLTNGNLTALKDGVDGCNGPYVYTASPAFPVSCYMSANYWVDAVFSTSGTPLSGPQNILQSTAEQSRGDSTGMIYSLSQNYPNPSVQNTRIDYSTPVTGTVELVLYDLLGRPLRIMVNEQKNAGTYHYDLNTSVLGKGIYFYKMTAGKYSDMKKMIVE